MNRTFVDPDISAIFKENHLLRIPMRPRDTQSFRVLLELSQGGRDTEGSVIEKTDLAVGVRHGGQPVLHPKQYLWPTIGNRPAIGVQDIEEIHQILDGGCMVHGAQLELTAIGQNLLSKLALDDIHSATIPAVGLHSLEIKTRE